MFSIKWRAGAENAAAAAAEGFVEDDVKTGIAGSNACSKVKQRFESFEHINKENTKMASVASSSSLAVSEINGGFGGSTSLTLSSIGSDLAVSISFVLANELVLAGKNEQMQSDEIVGLLLLFSIVLTAVTGRLRSEIIRSKNERKIHKLQRRQEILKEKSAPSAEESDALLSASKPESGRLLEDADDDGDDKNRNGLSSSPNIKFLEVENKTFLEFLLLLISIAQRICVSTTVQLLAVEAQQNSDTRLQRVISLAGVACFFVFIELL